MGRTAYTAAHTHSLDQQQPTPMDLRAACFRMAADFATSIVQQDYQAARKFLTEEAQSTHTAEAIRTAVEAMISYASGPIRRAEVIESAAVERWPGQRHDDVAVVYVSLTGDSFSEAVQLTFSRQSNQLLIRDLAWGRP